VPARITLDATETDASKMIKAISDQVAETRAEPGLRISDPLSDVLTRLPTTTTTAMFGSMLKGVDFTTSNVPGAPITVFLAGAELQQQYALGPMSGAGANVTLLSYLDMVHLGVNVDTAAVTDPDLLMECLRKSYDDILALAP